MNVYLDGGPLGGRVVKVGRFAPHIEWFCSRQHDMCVLYVAAGTCQVDLQHRERPVAMRRYVPYRPTTRLPWHCQN